MGRGSRHSKNAGVMGAESLTYHERKAMGYGTLSERLGKVRKDACAMCQETFCHEHAASKPTH
jgi:hypothetical protein